MINKDFYPTPPSLIAKMIGKIKGHPERILEPSAGKGDIVREMTNHYNRHYTKANIFTIENDPELQATLRGHDYNLIDSDFLGFSGQDKYDLIIGNPPFADGDKHLRKAIDIMYRGEIIFLLNAETIRNPHTLYQKDLVKKLTELNASIEYIQDAFVTAERPTKVEVALIYINIERKVEDDLFAECTDQMHHGKHEFEENYEVSTKNTIEELVAEYDQIIKIGTETIIGYYKNWRKIGKYIALDSDVDGHISSKHAGDMTYLMQEKLNTLLKRVRNDFWHRVLDLKEVRCRMTRKRHNEFEEQLKKHCFMNFTEHNIRQFVINFVATYEDSLIAAVLDVFDQFTIRHCYDDGLFNDNIHYFDGWKTNKAFRVNKKVIIPCYGGYGDGPFTDGWSKKWKMHYSVEEKLRDIDVVMNYFDGMSGYVPMATALSKSLEGQESRNIHSTYFTMTAYKKGTLHLTFNSDDILRRFNVIACRGKNFLPQDYGKKPYQECSDEEKNVIDAFEGPLQYNKFVGLPVFAKKNNQLLLTAESEAA